MSGKTSNDKEQIMKKYFSMKEEIRKLRDEIEELNAMSEKDASFREAHSNRISEIEMFANRLELLTSEIDADMID